MSRDGDLLDDVVVRLRQVRERLGPDVYRAAARVALHAIAVAVLDEAERRAGLDRLSGVIPPGNSVEEEQPVIIMTDCDSSATVMRQDWTLGFRAESRRSYRRYLEKRLSAPTRA